MSKKNYNAVRYGTKDGEIKFGHIHDDNKIAAFIVRSGSETNHYISMDSEGKPHRKHGTICRSTGSFQVKAGDNVKSSDTEENIGVYIEAVSGDIVLNAGSGRIRLIAENIDFIASGGDGKNGIINIDANEKVIVKSPVVSIEAKASMRLISENSIDLIGRAILNCYGGLIDFADGSTKIIGSKGGSVNEDKNK
jgi:hypothetical protein